MIYMKALYRQIHRILYSKGHKRPAVDPLSVDNLIRSARSLPKEIFISQVLTDSSPDRDRLDGARLDLFDCIKASVPFDPKTSLKKRIQTRTGDSLEYKLTHDVNCLSLVLDGADWKELRKVVNVPRSNEKSSSQVNLNSSFQAFNITEIEKLKKKKKCPEHNSRSGDFKRREQYV